MAIQEQVCLNSTINHFTIFELASRRGRYSLSTRTLAELALYIKDTYPDEVNECTICMEVGLVFFHARVLACLSSAQLVTRGVACVTANCKARMHYHCFIPFRISKSRCPACDEPWPQDADALLPIGEKAVKDQDDVRRQVRRRSPDEEEDEEMYDEEPSQPSQSQVMPRTQRSRKKGKAKQENMDVDELDDEDDPPLRSQVRGTRQSRRNR
jgi:hypothetical protein